MKKYYITLTIYVLLIFKAQSQNWVWAHQYSSAGITTPNNIITDGSGNIYITGVFQGSLIIGNDTLIASTGNWSYYLAKFTGSGTPLWAKSTYSNNGWQEGASIALDPLGNIIVTGFFSTASNFGTSICNGSTYSLNGGANMGVLFIVKYDPSGNLCWAIQNSQNGLCKGIDVVCDSNSIYVTGVIVGTVGFSAPGPVLLITSNGGFDIFVAKFNSSNGFVLWAKNAGSSYMNSSFDEQANSIALDPDGNTYITGSCYPQAVFDTITVGGISNVIQMFVSKYDSLGAVQWVKTGIGNGNYPVYGDDIAIDANGMLYASGIFKDTAYFSSQLLTTNSVGAFVVKYDNNGNVIRKNSLEGVTQFDEVAANSIGETFVTGVYPNQLVVQGDTLSNFGTNQNLFVSKFDTAGTSLWNQCAGGGVYNFPKGVANYNNHVYITGGFIDSTYFGNDTLINNDVSHSRLFLAEINDSTFVLGNDGLTGSNDGVKIYPNPSSSAISILIEKHNFKNVSISIKNIAGQTIFDQQGKDHGMSYNTIDIRSLSQGIYFIEVIVDGERTVRKIVKE